MCTYNTINSHTNHLEIQKRDSEGSLLTFVNFVISLNYSIVKCCFIVCFGLFGIQHKLVMLKLRNPTTQLSRLEP